MEMRKGFGDASWLFDDKPEEVKQEFNTLFDEAECEMRLAANMIEEHDYLFNVMDLKLHDVSFYLNSEEMEEEYPYSYKESDTLFDLFCNEQYDYYFGEGAQWSDHYLNYIGSTSSFHLISYNGVPSTYTAENRSIEDFIEETMDGDLEVFSYYEPTHEMMFVGDIDYTDIGAIKDELLTIKEHVVGFVYINIDELEILYTAITAFKKNQVQLFKDWLVIYEEKARYEDEDRERIEAETEEARKFITVNFPSIISEGADKYILCGDVDWISMKRDLINNQSYQLLFEM